MNRCPCQQQTQYPYIQGNPQYNCPVPCPNRMPIQNCYNPQIPFIQHQGMMMPYIRATFAPIVENQCALRKIKHGPLACPYALGFGPCAGCSDCHHKKHRKKKHHKRK